MSTTRRAFGAIFEVTPTKFAARLRLSGRQHSKRFRTRAQAERWLVRQQAELDAGTFVAPVTRRTTFDDGAAMIVGDYQMNGRKSLDRLEDALNHLRPTFGGLRLGTITADRIVAYVNARRGEGAAPATVQKEVAALRRVFRLALVARKVTPAQVPSFPRLTVNNARTGFLTEADFATLRRELDADVGPMIEFMFRTGWRRSEAQGLTWDRVDWEGKVVRLDLGTTKNGAARLFPFGAFPALEALLHDQRARTDAAQRQRGQVIPCVFHRAGAPIRSFDDHWRHACARAGLVGLIPHDLRRSAIRNLVRAGVPEQTAMRLSGHKTRAIFDRYDIVDEQDLRDGVAKLAAYAQGVQRAGRKVVALS